MGTSMADHHAAIKTAFPNLIELYIQGCCGDKHGLSFATLCPFQLEHYGSLRFGAEDVGNLALALRIVMKDQVSNELLTFVLQRVLWLGRDAGFTSLW
eukprot:m.25671 g.25671  ORF g.25671 m.25671 type:complete len:98 (-) comp11618_c0_seq1:57-350(-)